MSSFENIEVSNGPKLNSLTTDVVKFNDENFTNDETPLIPGEKFSFPGLQPKAGFTFLDAVVEKGPEVMDPFTYEEFYDIFLLTIKADSTIYNITDDRGVQFLIDQLVRWIIPSDWHNEYMKIIDHKIISSTNICHTLSVTLICHRKTISDIIGEVSYSPFNDVWDKHMNDIITEGVCYTNSIPEELILSLRKNIDYLGENTKVDYHPNSNDIVRDLVHPALYPYVKGVSMLNKDDGQYIETDKKDIWGRPYEDSMFQWLPTPFHVSKEGKCSILDYVNNLNREKFSGLYTDLEKLFEVFVPYFQEVWSYSKAIFFSSEMFDFTDEPLFVKENISFLESDLQVIVKIVEYTLQPTQIYEGVWHAEGMSHENIVMTGILFLERSTDISGGDLQFKRSSTSFEQAQFQSKLHSDYTVQIVEDFIDDGFIPLGRFPTNEGYLLVFPNCHIHKISKMVNTAMEKSASRRIVAFFVVNPEKKIVSTIDVPAQQDIMSLEDAKKYRLELMAERKYDKEKLNIREINLCEH